MEEKIIVYNTCIHICNYGIGDCKELEDQFSLPDKTNPLMAGVIYKAIDYDEANRVLTLPRGMDIGYLEALFNTQAVYNTNSDPYDINIPFRLAYKPRDDVQREAIQFILGEDKYAYLNAESQLGINLNTGAGKTYVTICCSAMIGTRSIMITSSLGWIEQWKNCILEYTDTTPSEIYTIVGSTSIAMILRNMVDISKIKYFLASHQTIHSYASNYGWDKVGELFRKLRVGIKIYDEAHLDFDNIWKIDFCTNTKKTLYLTATPFRSDKEEDAVYQTTFLNVPKIDLFDKERDQRTRYISVLYNSYPTQGQIFWANNKFGFDRNKYCSYIIKNEQFYKILTIAIEMIMRTGKTLIYIGTNAAIKTVFEWIISRYPELANEVGIYTSIVTNKFIKEQQLDKMIILSTTKSCAAAIDIKGLKMTMVLAEPFKSKVIARQSLGRTRDRNTTYVEFVDVGFPAIEACYNSKKPVFEKYATSCTEERFCRSRYNFQTKEWEKDDSILLDNLNEAIACRNARFFERTKDMNPMPAVHIMNMDPPEIKHNKSRKKK